jgi:hypothetical protein
MRELNVPPEVIALVIAPSFVTAAIAMVVAATRSRTMAVALISLYVFINIVGVIALGIQLMPELRSDLWELASFIGVVVIVRVFELWPLKLWMLFVMKVRDPSSVSLKLRGG